MYFSGFLVFRHGAAMLPTCGRFPARLFATLPPFSDHSASLCLIMTGDLPDILLLLHMMISDLMTSDCGLTMRTSISAQSGHGHEERVLVCSHSVDSCTVPVKCSFITNTKEHIGLCFLLHCLTLFQLPIFKVNITGRGACIGLQPLV